MAERAGTDGRWHTVAVVLLALATLWNGGSWLARDVMPTGDFPGYAAQVERVRDAILASGVVPRWCAECYAGSSAFTGNLKEILVLPLAVVFEPVLATKLAFLILKLLAGLGLYALIARWFAAPAAGIVAGYALAFGSIANHQLEHLDAVLATALLPPTLWVAASCLKRGGVALAVALGALAACHLVNNWVFALSVPLLVLALVGFAPWRDDASPHPWRDRRVAGRQAARVGIALVVFFALAASTLAWTAADAPNHRLVPEDAAARQRMIYVERSPFLFLNRANALGPWLAEHHPPGFDLATTDFGRRYLGGVALAVVGVGLWLGLRRGDARWRRWSAVAASLFGVHYWLSLGPRTWWWQVGTSLHLSEPTIATLHFVSTLVGIAAMTVVAVALSRDRAGGVRAWHGALFGIGLVALALAHSLWNGVAAALPPLAVQRSPGRFFEMAPTWWALLFAVALVAIERRFASRRVALACVAVVGIAVVADFAPSRRHFEAGLPLEPLRRMRARVAALPGEDATLRIGLPIAYRPVTSWLLAASEAGHAWGWLPWQSGRYWADYYARSLYATRGPRPDGSGPIDPDDALVAAARIQHLLVPATMRPPPGWRRVGASGDFALWKGPEVAPYARGFRATVWLDDPMRSQAPALASRALRANAVLVSPPPGATGAEWTRLRDAARAVVRPGLPLPGLVAAAPQPVVARIVRDGPERLSGTIDAGAEPAMLALSEGYHPWWRAEVDGEPAPVLRASHAMMAVPVPAGEHAIALRFVPPVWVRAAEATTFAGCLAVAGFAAAALARRAAQKGRIP